jgi:hypothetical protein
MVEIDYLAESRLRRRLHRRKHPDQRVLAIVPFDTRHNRRMVVPSATMIEDLPRWDRFEFFLREAQVGFYILRF